MASTERVETTEPLSVDAHDRKADLPDGLPDHTVRVTHRTFAGALAAVPAVAVPSGCGDTGSAANAAQDRRPAADVTVVAAAADGAAAPAATNAEIAPGAPRPHPTRSTGTGSDIYDRD